MKKISLKYISICLSICLLTTALLPWLPSAAHANGPSYSMRQFYKLPEAEKSGGMGALALVLALVVLGGGGAFAYIKFIRPKQASKVSADPDDYDFADEEEYINEDEPEPEEEMEDTK